MLRTLAEQSEPASIAALARASGLSRTKVASAVARLEDRGALDRDATGLVTLRDASAVPEAEIHAAVDAHAKLRETLQARVEPMQAYARTRECRRALLLGHFGDPTELSCSGCDNCDRASRV